MDNLSKPELRMLLSIMEGELEARDLVIEALRVSYRVVVVYIYIYIYITFSFANSFVLSIECY